MAAIALVQGASRGLGLQFCKHILTSSKEATVIATCRRPAQAGALQALLAEFPQNLALYQLDTMQEAEVQQAAEAVAKDYGRLDLLLNCGAMLHPSGRGETSLRDVSAEGLSITLATNSIGPLLVAKHFAPLLLNGTGAFGRQNIDPDKKHQALLVNMTAKVGSIGDNVLGGWYSYRMSKAALNMAMKNLSIELRRGKAKVVCVSLHPGTVDTDLSKPYHKNVPKGKLFSPEYSVNCLMHIIDNLDMEQTGKFFAWDGSELPW
ncbi:C-factor-like isoform X1 [Sceloporus undulatus]|uniref:C-factor-like isoform X1 n=1 Tax=Sceloporus undulatus TaxID=8520 RepID=UPI001C4CCE1D|nr:C-factor-like isoform X1 [Sceloporus undulatus]